MVTFAFWAMAYGISVLGAGRLPSGSTSDIETTGVLAIGLALSSVPPAYLLAALLSRRPDWPLGVLAAMGLALVVGLPLLIFQNPLAALLAGTAAGAVVAVEREPGTTWHNRAIAAAVVAVVVIAGLSWDPTFPIVAVVGPALPFSAVGLADMVTPDPLEGVAD